MATAKVKLKPSGPVSWNGRGRRLAQGDSIVVSGAEDILFFSTRPEFTVEMLDGPKRSAPAPAKKGKGKKPKPPPEPEPEEDEDEEPEEQDEPDPEEESEEDGEVTPEYTASDLNKMKKDALQELAEELELEVDEDATKAQLVDAILESQGGEE